MGMGLQVALVWAVLHFGASSMESRQRQYVQDVIHLSLDCFEHTLHFLGHSCQHAPASPSLLRAGPAAAIWPHSEQEGRLQNPLLHQLQLPGGGLWAHTALPAHLLPHLRQ